MIRRTLHSAKRATGLLAAAAVVPLLLVKRWLYRATGGRWFRAARPGFYRLLLPRQLFRGMPRMTSSHERAYLEWYARHDFTGAGEIVDLGPWMGATTVALARGLVRNRAPAASRRSIHVYDLFRWEPWMGTLRGTRARSGLEPGDSFRADFESFVAPWRERVEVHEANLEETAWEGGPIEFLLVDAMKSWRLAAAIVRGFYGALMPGAYLLQQDFCHHFEYWIHPIHYRLRDHLAPQIDLPFSAGVVFRVRETLPRELTAADYRPSSFDEDELQRAFEWAMSIVSRNERPSIAAARLRCILEQGGRDAARSALEELRAAGPLPLEVEAVENELDEGRSSQRVA
ncbi:MAG: hypothetical protein R3325_08785 [Thermoanaerobaculia bacterium]|nr:hypothetical protein [Thermoanaerobaculia bacterium]